MTWPRCGPSRTIISKRITEISAEDVTLNHHLYALLGSMPLLFLSETIDGTRSLFSTELFLAAGALGLVSNLGAGHLNSSITRSNTPLVASVAIMIVPLLSLFMEACYYPEALNFEKVAMAVNGCFWAGLSFKHNINWPRRKPPPRRPAGLTRPMNRAGCYYAGTARSDDPM